MGVAVLCADSISVYHSIEAADVYDEKRDARTFRGGVPVVAHPPCRAWSAYCRHQAKPPPGEAELGPMCVAWLALCGGVLEHPAHSRLWAEMDLPLPGDGVRGCFWAAAVKQVWWGGPVVKNTWLLFAHIPPAAVEFPFVLHDPKGDREKWNRLSKRKRAATPEAMARWMISTAMEAITYGW